MISIAATLNALKLRGIEVEESNGNIRYFGLHKPTDWELDLLKAQKQEILTFVRARRASPHGHIEATEAPAEPSFAQLLWMQWLGIGTPEEQILSLNACAVLPATDVESAKRALLGLLELHEALRYGFDIDGDTAKIRLNEIETFEFEHEDISECTNGIQAQSNLWKLAKAFSEIPIPANGSWLFRAKLVSLFGNATAVLMRINHLVADAASLEIIRSDLIALGQHQGFEQLRLRKCVRYADFVAGEKQWYRENGADLERYWSSWNSGIPGLCAPEVSQPLHWSDGPRSVRKFILERELLWALETRAGEVRTTTFLFLLTALARAIARWSNQNRFAIRTLFDRRTTPELRSVVGLLLGADAIRIEIEKEESFLSSLQRLKLEFLAAQQVRAPSQYCFPPRTIIANKAGHLETVPIIFNCRTLRSQLPPSKGIKRSLRSVWPSEPINTGVESWGRPSAPIVFEFFGLRSHAELHVRLNNEQISGANQKQLIEEFQQTLSAEIGICL